MKIFAAFLLSVSFAAQARPSIESLIGWAPDSETNCVTSALYASSKINDFMHVDPDEFTQFVLPYCYRKVDAPKAGVLVAAFGTSDDELDYRRLLHIFYLGSGSTAINKAGPSKQQIFEKDSLSEFQGQMQMYFADMAAALNQNVVGNVEYYEEILDERCPLNNYEVKLREFVKEPIFFKTRELLWTKIAAKDANLNLLDFLSKSDLIEAHNHIDTRSEQLYDEIEKDYRGIAKKHDLPFAKTKDYFKIYSLVKSKKTVANIQMFFYLRLARKQLRMALGLRELDALPKL